MELESSIAYIIPKIEKIPSIMSLDKTGRVIYLGTFSKTFCPGFRLGWVCANEEILSKYIIAKQGADLQSSSISQREAALFMQTYKLDDHIENALHLLAAWRSCLTLSARTGRPPASAGC